MEVELSVARLLKICWLILWRGIAGSFIMGFFIGIIFGILWAALYKVAPPTSVSFTLGLIVGIVYWPFVVRMALKKKYRDFRIVLVPPEAGVSTFD